MKLIVFLSVGVRRIWSQGTQQRVEGGEAGRVRLHRGLPSLLHHVLPGITRTTESSRALESHFKRRRRSNTL